MKRRSSDRTRHARFDAFVGPPPDARPVRRLLLHFTMALSLLSFVAAVGLWGGLEERV